MSRQVVFGTGQVGRLLAGQLAGLGHDVVAVHRSGRADLPGIRVVAADATDPASTRAICAGAEVVYFCLNATHYDRWTVEFPPLQAGVLAGATHAGARLVVLDNLYAYGPTGGRPLVETMAEHPTSAKSATRAAMTAELLAADAAGRVRVAVGRASDYFGPGTRASALGETVFGAAVRGTTAQVMGDPDQPHSYSYTPDVAAALVTLGSDPGATGAVWHLSVTTTVTTREVVERVFALAGRPPRIVSAGRLTLAALGLVKPALREYRHTLYQFTKPWVVDDSRFRAAYGEQATDLDSALTATLAWFRAAETSARPTTPQRSTR